MNWDWIRVSWTIGEHTIHWANEPVSRHGIVANVVDCDIVVSKFKLQSRYYIPFWTNTLAKGMNSLIPLC